MHRNSSPFFLLASHDPALLATMEPVLLGMGERVQVVLSAQDALSACDVPTPPAMAILDDRLPGMERGLLMASLRMMQNCEEISIVLISDTVTSEWRACLAEGGMDDLIPRSTDPSYWRLRLDRVQRARQLRRELADLRDAALLHAQLDRLTGAYNRETILTMLVRETDRVQRMKSSLSLVLFDIDDFGHWNSSLGAEACDELLCQVAGRTTRLLRSYDLLGRSGKDEFLTALPGSSASDAMRLAERLSLEVFAAPFQVSEEFIRLSACFGIAASLGRSPIVVLREAEQALATARADGPESIHCYDGSQSPARAPVTFASPTTGAGDERLAW